MFGLCWFSEQRWLTGKQFWLSHAVAKNVVPEFSGGLPLQEIAATCLEVSARLEGGLRKLFAATGGSSANGAGGARTRASATILSGVMKDLGVVLWQFVQLSPWVSRGVSLH